MGLLLGKATELLQIYPRCLCSLMFQLQSCRVRFCICNYDWNSSELQNNSESSKSTFYSGRLYLVWRQGVWGSAALEVKAVGNQLRPSSLNDEWFPEAQSDCLKMGLMEVSAFSEDGNSGSQFGGSLFQYTLSCTERQLHPSVTTVRIGLWIMLNFLKNPNV